MVCSGMQVVHCRVVCVTLFTRYMYVVDYTGALQPVKHASAPDEWPCWCMHLHPGDIDGGAGDVLLGGGSDVNSAHGGALKWWRGGAKSAVSTFIGACPPLSTATNGGGGGGGISGGGGGGISGGGGGGISGGKGGSNGRPSAEVVKWCRLNMAPPAHSAGTLDRGIPRAEAAASASISSASRG